MSDAHKCLQCGYDETGKNPSHHIPLSAVDNVSSIEDRVRLLDSEISSLNEERAQLLRKRNALASPIRRCLPPEILSDIFRYVCPPIDFAARPFDTSELVERPHTPFPSERSNLEINGPYIPVVLGSVCSFWRQVARSTPDLWTTIVLEVRERTAANHARLLQLYISRSKTFPVCVELDLRKEQKLKHPEPPATRAQKLAESLRPIRNILFHQKAKSKIAILRLIAPPSEWLPSIAHFPRLESLSLGWPFRFCLRPTDSEELDLSNLRHLTHVTLSRDLRVVLPWSQITNLKLHYLPITTCLEILFRCENVQKCRVRYPYSAEPGLRAPEALQGGPVVLKNLRFLEWPPISAAPMLTFFSRLNLPSLRRLRWEGNGDLWGSGAKELALNFFKRLPMTMTTLELIGETFVTAQQRDAVRDFLSVIPQLEHLILDGIRSEVPLANILEALGCDDELSSEGRPLLPALRMLEFRNSQKCRLLPTFDLRTRLIDMLRGRYLRSDCGLSIKLDVELKWTDEQKEDWKQLNCKGFQLGLWEGGKQVNWLNPLESQGIDE